jgi:hypothetical protein
MAKEGRVGDHPGKVLTEVGEGGHTCHSIRREIQDMEAECVHDVIEEI